MAQKSVVAATLALLQNTKLTVEDRNLLTTALLQKLGALPTRARLQLEQDTVGRVVRVILDGKQLNEKTAYRLSRSARSLVNNFAYKLIQETLDFMAIKQGVHFNTSPEQGLFAKAILWQHNEERQLVEALTQYGFEDEV